MNSHPYSLNLHTKRPRRHVTVRHWKGRPQALAADQWLQTDNGSEFISKSMELWAYENRVTMDFSHPGKYTDNAFIESFNGSLRDECLNVRWFLLLEDAQKKIEY